LWKERKLSAVKLVSTGKIKSGRREHKLAENQDLMWQSRTLLFQSTSWKSGKSKSEILRFAKLITEKGSSDDYHAIEKAKSKRI
jgi:hypothetical protein